MKIAQVVFFMAAVFKVSILVFPAREQVYIYYKMDRSTVNHTLLSVGITGVVFMIPCIFPDIDSILDLLGGLFLGTLGFSTPVALKIASLYYAPANNRLALILNSILLFTIVTVQLTATTMTLIRSIKGNN